MTGAAQLAQTAQKIDRWRPVPLTHALTVTGACDALRRRHCDAGGIARSEAVQAVGVRVLVRVTVSVTHRSPGNASDPKEPPDGG